MVIREGGIEALRRVYGEAPCLTLERPQWKFSPFGQHREPSKLPTVLPAVVLRKHQARNLAATSSAHVTLYAIEAKAVCRGALEAV